MRMSLLASVVVVLASPAWSQPGSPDPDYVGPFFWVQPQGERPGNHWSVPAMRSWEDDYSRATSFPDRIWNTRQVGDAPPNDAGFGPGDSPHTDPEYGPYGLQTVQYLLDWWQGTTYRRTMTTPAGWSEAVWGGFGFAPRGDRADVAPSADGRGAGLPEGFVGNPGACAARAIADMFGSGVPWRSHFKDARSGSVDDSRRCLSQSSLHRLRLNTELRYEPLLRDLADPYVTARYKPVWDGWIIPADLLIPAMIFPPDYERSPWFRRMDILLQGMNWSQGTRAVPAGWNAAAGVYGAGGSQASTYAERYLPWLNANASGDWADFNPFTPRDAEGRRLDGRVMRIYDGVARGGPEQLRGWGPTNINGAASSSWDPSLPSYASVGSIEAGGVRVPEAGIRERRMAPAGGATVREYDGPVPLPRAGAAFWTQWNTPIYQCTWYVALVDQALPQKAAARADEWEARYWAARARWEELVANAPTPMTPKYQARIDAAREEMEYEGGVWQGWETVLAYREGTQLDLESALGGAQYAVAGPARTLNFGTSACGVGTHTLTTVRHSPVLASGPHGPLDTLQSDGSRTAQAAGLPRYYRPERAVGGFTTSVTPRARAAHAAGLGARYPAGIHEWSWSHGVAGAGAVRSLACGAPYERFYAQRVRALRPDAGAMLYEGLGDAGNLSDSPHPWNAGVATVWDSTREVASMRPERSAPDGRYVDGAREDWDWRNPNMAVQQAEIGMQDATYHRTTSGDLDPDGNLITWSTDVSRRATDYEATPGPMDVNLGFTAALETGVPEVDYRLAGAPAHGSAGLRFREHYMGVAPGTAAYTPPSTTVLPDEEHVDFSGPVRYLGAMRAPGVGGCTLVWHGEVDFEDARHAAAVDDPGMALTRTVCFISETSRPLADCPSR